MVQKADDLIIMLPIFIFIAGILFFMMMENTKNIGVDKDRYCDDMYGENNWKWYNNCTENITRDICLICKKINVGEKNE